MKWRQENWFDLASNNMEGEKQLPKVVSDLLPHMFCEPYTYATTIRTKRGWCGAAEMVQGFRALVAFAEDLGLAPNIHVVPYNHL